MPISHVFGSGSGGVEAPTLAWVAPTTVTSNSGTTTQVITFNPPTGGRPPYTYGTPTVSYDSTETGYATVSRSDLDCTVINLVDNATYVISLTATDSEGSVISVEGTIVVLAGVNAITFASRPSNQTLEPEVIYTSLSAWGSPSGGTAPYTYAVTEPTGRGVTITGSGLGPYIVDGLTSGRSYVILMTVTDSLGAKGYSAVSVSVGYAPSGWSVVADIDFTDSNWTALNSTDNTSNSGAVQHTIYGSDGTTPRVQIWNTTTQSRRLRIDPSSTGLTLRSMLASNTPSIKVVPVDALNRPIFPQLDWTNDIIKVEFHVESEEPYSNLTYVNLACFSSAAVNGAIQHGYRIVGSGYLIYPQRRSWHSSATDVTQSTVSPGSTRKCQLQMEMYITGSRTIESYGREGATVDTFTPTPRTGKYYFHQSVAQVMATVPTKVSFTTTSVGGWGIFLYLDGSAVDSGTAGGLSRVTLRRLRISRLPGGALP
jgi:hypothetical protein